MSFPEPVLGTVKRPVGQGCTSCVHKKYCSVFYWYQRFTEVKPEPTVGTQCASWSNNEVDRITTQNADDKAYNLRMHEEGLLAEVDRNGEDDPGFDAI